MAYADVELKKIRNRTVLGFKFSLLTDKDNAEGQDRYVGLILEKERLLDQRLGDSIMIICHHNKASTTISLSKKYMIHISEPGTYTATLKYSTMWGNFKKDIFVSKSA